MLKGFMRGFFRSSRNVEVIQIAPLLETPFPVKTLSESDKTQLSNFIDKFKDKDIYYYKFINLNDKNEIKEILSLVDSHIDNKLIMDILSNLDILGLHHHEDDSYDTSLLLQSDVLNLIEYIKLL